MSGWDESAITITTLLPVAGALVIVMVPKEKDRLVRALGILFTGAALVLAIAIAIGFDYHKGGLQYVLNVSWISAIGARYHVGIDGHRACRCTCSRSACRSCARSTPGGTSPIPAGPRRSWR